MTDFLRDPIQVLNRIRIGKSPFSERSQHARRDDDGLCVKLEGVRHG